MLCKNCGASLNENVKFCPECGTPRTVAAPASEASSEPKAPMYTTSAPEYTYAQPAYAQAVPYEDPSPILTWGIVGLICAFIFNVLGIIFSAIAISKAKHYADRYGVLPDQARTGRGLGLAGLIISILSLVLTLLILAFSIAAFSTVATYIEHY